MSVIGNLGQDCTIRHWNGKQAISFSIAFNEKYKDKDGIKHERTIWVNCTIWREGQTELIKYLKKGQQVYVEGNPEVSTYVSKQTGEVIPDLKLRVRELQLLGGRPKEENGQAQQQGVTQQQQQPVAQPQTQPPQQAQPAMQAHNDQTVPWEE
jgi:single-strand DNA-binding protein